MNRIEQFLQDHKVLILDGAMATELESKGLDLNDALWSAKVLAEQPDVIEQVHYEYFQAGADCAMTASYQAKMCIRDSRHIADRIYINRAGL